MDNQKSINELVEEFISTMDCKGNTKLLSQFVLRRAASHGKRDCSKRNK